MSPPSVTHLEGDISARHTAQCHPHLLHIWRVTYLHVTRLNVTPSVTHLEGDISARHTAQCHPHLLHIWRVTYLRVTRHNVTPICYTSGG